MVTHGSITKDVLYGSPPAYSTREDHENPPPSYVSAVYAIPEIDRYYSERPVSPISVALSSRFSRYLLIAALFHVILGAISVLCDIILSIMTESYLFAGIWAGTLSVLLGLYLFVFTHHSQQTKLSFQRLKFLHLAMCLIITVALILSSINLAKDSCYTGYFEFYPCRSSAHRLKAVLVSFFTFTFLQLCLTFFVACFHTRR